MTRLISDLHSPGLVEVRALLGEQDIGVGAVRGQIEGFARGLDTAAACVEAAVDEILRARAPSLPSTGWHPAESRSRYDLSHCTGRLGVNIAWNASVMHFEEG